MNTQNLRLLPAALSILLLGGVVACGSPAEAGSPASAATVTVTAISPGGVPTTVTAPPTTVISTPPAVTRTSTVVTTDRTTAVTTVQQKVTKNVTVTETAPPPDPVTVTAEPAGPAAAFGSGTQLVGVDIEPGTYRAPGGDRCYWERLSGASGDLDDILANDLAPTNPVVEIAAGDYAFTSDRCGDWARIG